MNLKAVAILSGFLIFVSACSSSQSPEGKTTDASPVVSPPLAPVIDEKPVEVTFEQLLAAPDQFQNRKIRINGFIQSELDGYALYGSVKDYQALMTSHAVWLVSDQALNIRLGELNKTSVTIEGTFDGKSKGDQSLWLGTLKNVEIVETAARHDVLDRDAFRIPQGNPSSPLPK